MNLNKLKNLNKHIFGTDVCWNKTGSWTINILRQKLLPYCNNLEYFPL